MGAFKKISSLLICAVCVLCTLGTSIFADDLETSNEIELDIYNVHYTAYANDNFDYDLSWNDNFDQKWTNWTRYVNQSNLTLPTTYSAFYSPSKQALFYYSFNFVDSNYPTVSKLQNSYTYIATYTIRISVQNSWVNDHGYTLPISLTDLYYGIYIDDDFVTWYNDSGTYRLDKLGYREVYNTNISIPAQSQFMGSYSIYPDEIYGEADPNTNNFYSFVVPVHFAFRIPDDYFESTDSYNVIGSIFGFPAISFDGDYYTRFFIMNLVGLDAYYDPDATIIVDPPTSEEGIIQGQKDAVDYGLDKEKEENQDAYNDSSTDGMSEASSTFGMNGYQNAFSSLLSAINYTGTDFSFKFPQLNVPFFDQPLSQEQTIPFKTYIDALPSGVLAIIRFLGWLGIIFSIIHLIRGLIRDINGGN